MIRADLYEKSIALESYVSPKDCCACGFDNRMEFLAKLRSGQMKPSECRLAKSRYLLLLWAARPEEILPQVESRQLPNPGPAGLFPINEPDNNSTVLVSGNSLLTAEVLTAVLATTLSPFWYLMVDTDGHTVDMALVYQVFTVERILSALRREGLSTKAPQATLCLPGLASPLCEPLAEQSGYTVLAGPVCAAELPLFFGEERWRLAAEKP